ncbi:hypothetical protein SprV_0301207300 [Sparganum proliferum]
MHTVTATFWALCIFVIATNAGLSTVPKGHPKVSKTKSVEKNLIRRVVERYRRFGVVGRPVNDSRVVLQIEYGLQLIQVLDIDENKQILRSNCWSMYRWNDSLLQWDPSEYGNVTEIRLFPQLIWTPDIQLYNFADERTVEHRIARVVVQSTGETLWVPQALFKSACQVGITFFPFDTQICTLEFGSWTYDVSQMDISWWKPDKMTAPMPYVDFSDYVPSNEWRTYGELEKDIPHENRTKQIKSLKRYRERNQTSGGKVTLKKYPVLCYRIRLIRNPSFYVFILVIPCILLSSLTIVIFWLPPESPAKMMLGMNIFVAFFLLLLLLADLTPNAVKEFPLIGAYFCLNMIMITLSTFLATLVIHLYYRGDRNGPLPAILHRVIVDGLGRLMLVRQHIPLPERKKTLSHVVTRSAITRVRRKIRMPELPSSKFMGPGAYETGSICRPSYGMGLMSSCMGGGGSSMDGPMCFDKTGDCVGGVFGYTHSTATCKLAAPMRCEFACPCGGNHSGGGTYGGINDSMGDLSASFHPRSAGAATCPQLHSNCDMCGHPTVGPLGTHRPPLQPSATIEGPCRGPAVDSEDSPIMLSTSTSLERDVRELKRYVRMFVNRQRENTKKNAIAMEWRTMALVLDRLFFFIYIATIGITVITSLPSTTELTVAD